MGPIAVAARSDDPSRAFDPRVRERVARIASASAPLADLAGSFPALLFAIATGHGSMADRTRAIARVNAGAPLRDIAREFGLAWWLRKLPASAFVEPLPHMPDGTEATLQLANCVPANPRLAAGWLQRVAIAERACGGAFTLWVARHGPALPHPLPHDDRFLMLAAWAWFSAATGTRGHRLLRRPWSPDMSPRKALDELQCWRQRLALVDWLGAGLKRGWIADGTALGYEFAALRQVEDFIDAALALDNCLDQFAPHIAAGLSSVVGVKKDGRFVACIEIVPHEQEVSMPAIQQLRGPRNRGVPPVVWQAAHAWLGGSRIVPFARVRMIAAATARGAARRELWAPFLAHVAGTDLAPQWRRLVTPVVPSMTRLRGVRRAVASGAGTRAQALRPFARDL